MSDRRGEAESGNFEGRTIAVEDKWLKLGVPLPKSFSSCRSGSVHHSFGPSHAILNKFVQLWHNVKCHEFHSFAQILIKEGYELSVCHCLRMIQPRGL